MEGARLAEARYLIVFYGALLCRFMPPADTGTCEKDPALEVLALRKVRVTCMALLDCARCALSSCNKKRKADEPGRGGIENTHSTDVELTNRVHASVEHSL